MGAFLKQSRRSLRELLWAIQVCLERFRQAASRSRANQTLRVGLISGSTSHAVGAEEWSVAWTVRVLRSRQARAIGLLNHVCLGPSEGVLLVNTRAVHGFGALFPIVAVFIDAANQVLALESVAPGQVARGPSGTRHVLELAHGQDVHFDRMHNPRLVLEAVAPTGVTASMFQQEKG